MSFPDNLKRRRKAWGLSQQYLAYKVRLSTRQISSYETGKSTPRPKTMVKLCRALKCTPVDLTRP